MWGRFDWSTHAYKLTVVTLCAFVYRFGIMFFWFLTKFSSLPHIFTGMNAELVKGISLDAYDVTK